MFNKNIKKLNKKLKNNDSEVLKTIITLKKLNKNIETSRSYTLFRTFKSQITSGKVKKSLMHYGSGWNRLTLESELSSFCLL